LIADVTAKNTIVAEALTSGNCGGPPPTSLGNNLSFESTGDTYPCFTAGNGNVFDDPMLGPLQNNGGPTQTEAIGPGSAALEAGSGCEATDQRGIARPQDSACDIGAYELIKQYTLSVLRRGSGTGTVTSSPAGIDCGASCAGAYNQGTAITLIATPSAGSRFAGWSGAGCSGTATCQVTLNSDQTVTANFAAQATLTIAKTGAGSGRVASSPAGIDCGGACSAPFDEGTAVTLTAAPDAGSAFAGWSGGGCSGTGTCAVTVGSDQSVSAAFDVVAPPPPSPPNTKIDKAKINQDKDSATFKFEALAGKAAAASGFQCALLKRKHATPKFKDCKSPKRYKHLKPRRYLFEVRAFDSTSGDPTPAKKRFRIK
jgi:hypothetical protein